MHDLTNNTFVIPYYHDSDVRWENLIHVLTYLNKNFKTNVIIGEQYSTHFVLEDQKDFFPNLNIDHCLISSFAENPELFHMTKLVNEMVKKSTTDFITILGCDNIVKLEQLTKAFELLEIGVCKVCYPFSKPTTDLPEEFKYLLKKFDYNMQKMEKYLVFAYTSGAVMFGNCIIYDRQLFMDIGGYNEEMVSWGSEDTEIYYRCFVTGVPMCRIEGFVFHLAHPRGTNSGDENPYRQHNKSICEKVKNMTQREVLMYIQESKKNGIMI